MSLPYRLLPLALSRTTALLRRLVKACEGVETIEFALAAIPLLTFLFGVVEFARLYWTQSELQYAAEAAARCATLVQLSKPNPASCGGSSVSNNAGVQSFAANQLLGMSVSSSNLVNFQVTAAACGNQVTFNYTFTFIVGPIIPNSALTLSATACNQA